jgi:hypothetical protein
MRCTTRCATVIAAFAGPAGAAMLFAQETTRVSVSSSGAEANSQSWPESLTADGRFIAFDSDASNLVSGDSNASMDVFFRDLVYQTTELVSVDSNGVIGNRYSYLDEGRSISDDGLRVVFESVATNLDPADTNTYQDVYLRDRASGTTTLISVDAAGNVGDQFSGFSAISGDGNFVCFSGLADNLVPNDTNSVTDVFVRDLSAGTIERVSVDPTGAGANSNSWASAISRDGRFVVFSGFASNLVAGDTNAAGDVFLRDRQLGTTELVSIATSGIQGDYDSYNGQISADGRFIAFDSWATNLVAGDTNLCTDVFVRDRTLGTTTRVSVSSSGSQGKFESYNASLSTDGRFVLFNSRSTTLVAGDTNGFSDVFEHDLVTGSTIRASVDSSGAESDGDSYAGDVSEGGLRVAFHSDAANLVASDTNGLFDVFVHDACGTLASWINYGAGFPGTNGVPSFTSQQLPSFGTTVTVDLANSRGQPTVGLLVVGRQRANLPTHRGGDLLVLPLLIAPITFSYGADSFTGTIPVDVSLCGATVDLQAIETDPGATFGLSFSQGLELVIGN